MEAGGMKPLAIDLFCGLGGWSEGLLAEGARATRISGAVKQPGVGSWDRSRPSYTPNFHAFSVDEGPEIDGCWVEYPAQLVIQDVLTLHGSQFKDAALIVASPPCQAYSYRAMPWSRAKALPPPCNALFDACFRIQREASEAAGRRIPMVVENVRGAQPWVGRARWNFGSYYLWGDVPALMPITFKAFKSSGMNWSDQTKRGQDFTRIAGRQAMDGIKVPGLKHGSFGRGFHQTAADHIKCGTSKGPARKAASAMIAKIPEPLSRHIARVYMP
jgi:hypothetical protein